MAAPTLAPWCGAALGSEHTTLTLCTIHTTATYTETLAETPQLRPHTTAYYGWWRFLHTVEHRGSTTENKALQYFPATVSQHVSIKLVHLWIRVSFCLDFCEHQLMDLGLKLGQSSQQFLQSPSTY